MRNFIFAMACWLPGVVLAADCPPMDETRESLRALKAVEFQVDDPVRRQALTHGLVDCLGDPDPAIRDGVAYEALATWMRAGLLEPGALRGLRDQLYTMLDADDADGFQRPFAALVLSEVARTDRVTPWMSQPEREAMVAQAAGFVVSVDDYRGYDPAQGWRHGVAHGADWLMQLALNPALTRAQLDLILGAVASQVVPPTHAYVFGEPQRLARPVLYVARRDVYDADDWQAWFGGLVARLGDPALAYQDAGWLARRHDLVAFLDAVYVEVDTSDDTTLKPLLPPVLASMKAVP